MDVNTVPPVSKPSSFPCVGSLRLFNCQARSTLGSSQSFYMFSTKGRLPCSISMVMLKSQFLTLQIGSSHGFSYHVIGTKGTMPCSLTVRWSSTLSLEASGSPSNIFNLIWILFQLSLIRHLGHASLFMCKVMSHQFHYQMIQLPTLILIPTDLTVGALPP